MCLSWSVVHLSSIPVFPLFFFFNDPATTEIYTLSLHDALPIWGDARCGGAAPALGLRPRSRRPRAAGPPVVSAQCSSYASRSEEHTSELQSRFDLVCRLLLEKKKKDHKYPTSPISTYSSTSLRY